MSASTRDSCISRAAFIGNYLPRQCGIATFTTDLCESFALTHPQVSCMAVPVNDCEVGYAYPARVRFELQQKDLRSYRTAADFLNINDVDVVCLQHEYGIFGGAAGSHILAMLRDLRMPVVTTLHTVLRDPNPDQRTVMRELAERSQRLVVMSQKGKAFLQEVYQIPQQKIDFIHHGIPDLPFVDPNFYKDEFGVAGKQVLLTFGLLSEGKGIEYVIRALPRILERYPDVVYLVVGATHPHVRQHQGESYRFSLQRLAESLAVNEHVKFYNRFIDLSELTQFIGAADIYITPYLNAEQITSGTLAYAVGAGKSVISTSYWYAQELLADGRGCLVPFRDPAAIAQEVLGLLDNPIKHHAMRKQAYLFGRQMRWETVAKRYGESFSRAIGQRAGISRRPAGPANRAGQRQTGLPRVDLQHLYRMTDDTGILQRACYTVPNYNCGYSTDDNACALVLAVLLEELSDAVGHAAPRLGTRYLAFLQHAWDDQAGRFRGALGYDRRLADGAVSLVTHARVVWALGMVLGRSCEDGLRSLAGRLFDGCAMGACQSSDPVAWAYTLIAYHEYARRFSGDRAIKTARADLADRLFDTLKRNCSSDWPWFSERLSPYSAVLPHALMVSGIGLKQAQMVAAGLRSLRWLTDLQTSEDGFFVPAGARGVGRGEGDIHIASDQHPIAAQTMVLACQEAFRITGDKGWSRQAQRAFGWFLGQNDSGHAVYDSATGGCREGVYPGGSNQNQSAQATMAFLVALVEMHIAENYAASADDDSNQQSRSALSFPSR